MSRSMDSCALPMELCERVIDALYSDGDDDVQYSCYRWLRSVSYPAWCQTSLVCFAWLKRSRFNLFYEVRLHNRSQLDLLLRTLSKTPSHADLILGLTIDPYWAPCGETYVPFAPLLTRLLRQCVSLRLTDNLPWYKYPPKYADLAFCHYQGRKLTHLSVCITTTNCAAIFRLIRSLPLLRELVLDLEKSYYNRTHQDPGAEVLSKVTRLHNSRKVYPLKSLRSLKLGTFVVPLSFPPLFFGASITTMSLCATAHVSDSILECIHAFKVLRSLRIWCALRKPIFSIWDEGAVGMLQSILKCVQSGSALHTVDIDVGRGLGGGHVYSSYLAPDCQDAHRFLRDLCGPNMLNTLEGFTGLHRLRVNLELEEKDLHDDSWWTTEVLRLLPPESPFRAVISVTASLIREVYVYDSFGPILSPEVTIKDRHTVSLSSRPY